LPDDFYSTYNYTQTGNNLTHPWTLGFLSKFAWSLAGVDLVGMDVRLNLGRTKFQPDIVAYEDDDGHALYIDYESPNSSDARVSWKDIEAYVRWRDSYPGAAPYILITTLPNKSAPEWELRYTGEEQWNERFKGMRKQLAENPFRFYYSIYKEECRDLDLTGLSLLNINGKSVELIDLKTLAF